MAESQTHISDADLELLLREADREDPQDEIDSRILAGLVSP